MKKTLFAILFISLCTLIHAQELPLPNEPSNGFAFPIGTKFTIKLHSVAPGKYDFSVIDFQPFDEIVSIMGYDDLFPKEGADDTLMLYFCLGTFGDTEAPKDEDLKILLLMKNYSNVTLDYSSDILRQEDGEYEETSNVGVSPGAVAVEMWPYMIHFIGLSDFHERDTSKDAALDLGEEI